MLGAKASFARLTAADLSRVDLRSANLQNANLDDSRITDVMLWEVQRAGWSIKGIKCERVYWDYDAKQATAYSEGEFERQNSHQTCIELFYQGGVSTFELNTLPALLHHLASLHANTNIRLKSIEETGGGAKILISVGNATPETTERIKADAMQVYQAQLALREDELNREKIEKKYLEKLLIGQLIPAMLAAGSPQNVFNATVTGMVIASGESKVDFHQTVNDNSAILALLEKIMDRRADLGLSTEMTAELEHEFQSTKAELDKETPDKRIVSKGIEFFKKVVTETATKAAGKFEDKVVSGDWQAWLHQLSQLLHHWK
jgi:Ser-tRNA(Ala) deacylase AlaX